MSNNSFTLIFYLLLKLFSCLVMLFVMQSTGYCQLYISESSTFFVQDKDLLFVVGDIENNGTISNITLSGSLTQSLTGNGSIGLLKVNKSTGTASILSGSNQSITESLDLTSGILSSNGSLTLKSTASGSVRVLSHTTNSSLIGNVVVEKYIDVSGRPHQWRTQGFPYSTSLSLSSISGFSIDYNVGSRSVMYFNEGADDGLYGATGSRNAGYVSFTSSSESIQPGHGVMSWLYGNAGGRAGGGIMSGGLTIVSNGTLNESGSDVSLPLSYDANPVNQNNRGWNLVSNPFVSTIDWNSLDIIKNNIGSSIYRWNPVSASWTIYNGLIGIPSGVDSYIEPGTSFFVQAVGPTPVLSISQRAKTGNSTGFVHLQRAPRINTLTGERVSGKVKLMGVRLSIKGQGNALPDEAYLDISRSDASPGFDFKYDAASMERTSGPSLALMGTDGKAYAIQFDQLINVRSDNSRYYPLRVSAPFKGGHSITIKKEGLWDTRQTIALIDQKEQKTILLREDSIFYSFIPDGNKLENRFVLAINHMSMSNRSDESNAVLKILGNPVITSSLNFSYLDENFSPKKWQIYDMWGKKLASGILTFESMNIQYQIPLPASLVSGSYLLSIENDSGVSRQQVFIKK